MRKLWVALIFSAILTGCSSPTYEELTPKFDLSKMFNGELHAFGIVRGRSGDLLRRFKVNLTGEWSDSGVGKLTEDFLYDDGERSQRVWTFTPTASGYIGRANDTLTDAEIVVEGPVLTLEYQIELEVGDASYVVTFDDALYAIDAHRIVNVSDITKFGFKVGEVVLVMAPQHIDLSSF